MMLQQPNGTPLVDRLVDDLGYIELTPDTLDAFVSAPGHAIIFAAGDGKRLDETGDVAVVLPELVSAFPDTFVVGVTRDRETEMAVQRLYRFNAFPALVFLRDGGWLGTIQRMQDWSDYLRDIRAFLASEAKEPPRFELPDGCQVAAPSVPASENPEVTAALQSRT